MKNTMERDAILFATISLFFIISLVIFAFTSSLKSKPIAQDYRREGLAAIVVTPDGNIWADTTKISDDKEIANQLWKYLNGRCVCK